LSYLVYVFTFCIYTHTHTHIYIYIYTYVDVWGSDKRSISLSTFIQHHRLPPSALSWLRSRFILAEFRILLDKCAFLVVESSRHWRSLSSAISRLKKKSRVHWIVRGFEHRAALLPRHNQCRLRVSVTVKRHLCILQERQRYLPLYRTSQRNDTKQYDLLRNDDHASSLSFQ